MAVTWKVKGKGMYDGERVFSSEYFIKNNCVSCGWGDPALQNRDYVVDFITYKEKWLEMYSHERKWGYQGIHHLFESLQKGDFLWTRLDGAYYVAKIPSDPILLFHLDYSPEASKYDSVVQLKNIKWVKCGTEESAPGSVSSFTNNRNSLVRIDKRESLQNGMTATSMFSNRVIDPDNQDLILDRRMILNFLGPSGFEDLIAIWLFDRFNYFVIPSTNKKSTQKYEFVMLDGSKENGHYSNKKRIYLQAKNGEVDLNIKDYLNLLEQSGDEVWLATSNGKVNNLDGKSQQNQIVRLWQNKDSYDYQSFNLEELINFVFDDAKRSILPDSIMTLMTFFSKDD
jgi:hypothetical protein